VRTGAAVGARFGVLGEGDLGPKRPVASAFAISTRAAARSPRCRRRQGKRLRTLIASFVRFGR
jgi:hypothetical protein